MHLVRYSAIISFAKLEANSRMRDRVTKPGKEFSIVGGYITIMQGNNMTVFEREDISVSRPSGSALAVFPDIHPMFS